MRWHGWGAEVGEASLWLDGATGGQRHCMERWTAKADAELTADKISRAKNILHTLCAPLS
eukprot:77017-Pyramimonas_sp.AAC.1